MMGPCAKTRVVCTAIFPDGRRVVGENACANPQAVCPRLPGEGYEKCKTICDQRGHAEEQMIAAAGGRIDGARVFVTGHTYYCQNCQEAMFGAGAESIRVGAPPA